jgi:protein-S-isoprenylcysteine O-methyltransferase Ste14
MLSAFMINQFDLFGRRQVFINLDGEACKPLEFKTTGLYRLVRHTLMLGFIISFWVTPRMTTGHLVFAPVTSV